jgi:hypothetical protein
MRARVYVCNINVFVLLAYGVNNVHMKNSESHTHAHPPLSLSPAHPPPSLSPARIDHEKAQRTAIQLHARVDVQAAAHEQGLHRVARVVDRRGV